MKKKIFTQIFATLIMLVAVVMNCYAQDVRYLVVEDLDGKELDAFYTDNIRIPKPVGNIVNIENTWDGEAKLYPYPMETTRFRFDTRAYGNATSTEVIATEKWYVTYDNGTLYVKGTTNAPISVYTITGMFVGRYQNTSEVNVYLNPGFYLVNNGKYTAKLLVNNNGYGSGSAEVQALMKSTNYAVNDPPAILRSGTVSTYSGDYAPYYWNIGQFPIDLNSVDYFQFNADGSVIVKLLNNSSVEIDYNGSTFSQQPVQSNSNWDLAKTFEFGGAAYGVNSSLPFAQWFTTQYITVFTANEIICYDVQNKVERKYPIKFIPNYEARVTMFYHSSKGLSPVYSYAGFVESTPFIFFVSIEDGMELGSTGAMNYGVSNLIETDFSIENGNLKATFKGGEYIFK